MVEKILHYTYLVDFSMDKLILRFPKIACRYTVLYSTTVRVLVKLNLNLIYYQNDVRNVWVLIVDKPTPDIDTKLMKSSHRTIAIPNGRPINLSIRFSFRSFLILVPFTPFFR